MADDAIILSFDDSDDFSDSSLSLADLPPKSADEDAIILSSDDSDDSSDASLSLADPPPKKAKGILKATVRTCTLHISH